MFSQQKQKPGAPKATRRNRFESDEDWNSSDSVRENKRRKHKQRSRTKSAKEKLVICKVCMEKPCQASNILAHVRNVHPEEYKGHEQEKGKYWIFTGNYVPTAGKDAQPEEKHNANEPVAA